MKKKRKMAMKSKLKDGDDDNLILSHLSTKRKEFLIERFEKIFTKFDAKVKIIKTEYINKINNMDKKD